MDFNELTRRVYMLESQVKDIFSALMRIKPAVPAQSQESQAQPAALIVNLKKVLRNGFQWFGYRVDVDHGLTNGLGDDDHPQYCPVGAVVITDTNTNPATIGYPGTWIAL